MIPGQMLCFSGPNFKRDKATLARMTDKDLLVEEGFKGAYSLTQSGFTAMKECE